MVFCFDRNATIDYDKISSPVWSLAMPIRVSCGCGREVNAPDNLAGKTVKCPGCKGPLRIPDPNAKDDDDIPVILLKKNRETAKPSGKSRKSKRGGDNSALVIGAVIGLGLLLLGGGGFLIWSTLSGGGGGAAGTGAGGPQAGQAAPEPGTIAAAIAADKETDETKLIPGDSKFVFSVQVGSVLQAPLVKSMLDAIGFEEGVKEMQDSLKIKPSDCRKIHVVFDAQAITRLVAEAQSRQQQQPNGNRPAMRPPGTGKLQIRPDGTVPVSTTLNEDEGALVAQALPLYPAQMQPGLQGGSSPSAQPPGSMQPPGGMAPPGGGPGMGGPGGPPQADAPFVAIISLAAPVSLDPPPSTITVAGTPVANAPGKTYSAQGFMLHACPGNQTLLYGQQKYLENLLKSKATSAGATVKKLREMLGKAENHMVMVAASEMSEAERAAAIGGMGPKFQYAAPLLEAKAWTLVGSATEDMTLELAGQFADEAKAKAGLEAATRLNKENNTFQTRLALTAFGAMAGPQGSKGIGVLTDALSQIKPAQDGNTVKVAANIKGAKLKALVPAGMGLPGSTSGGGKTMPSVVMGTPPPGGSSQNTGIFSGGSTGGGAVQSVRGAVARAAGQNELKQIGLALQTYMTENNGLPPAAITDASGKRLLSWRVAILPYLEQDNLHKQFRLNEPWDSPHNRQLLNKMPKQFGGDSNGLTAVRAFAGPGMGFEWTRRVGISEITDGTSNTALIADASSGVEWTKPDELDFAGSAPIVLGQPNQTTVNVLFADGSVKRVPKTLSPAEWKSLATRAGGEPFKLP